MSTVTTPIINLKPTNLTQEDFLSLQKFGLQPYDRAPTDYLRFVAKVFTAWRDPDDTILNYDPFDDTYGTTDSTTTTTTLQATSDKSIIAYIDGFQATYNFVRLTTDEESTDLTKTSVSNPTTTLTNYTTSTGDIITIDQSKYGEYHRFTIKAGLCFIDNQLVQITEETTWWFRVPDVNEVVNGVPTFELGQFIVDPLNVYSLLPNKNYKIILSYEYITQFEANSARLRFETDETAIDEPYLLIATFSTNDYGLVHQTLPINESSIETFNYYIIKEDIDPTTNLVRNYYYLKDINPQYLDKKYMSNHKNLFKHLQTQLLTVLADSKISNVFHCKEMTENIHPSCSSGDMVYYDGTTSTWYPAEVSRQDFDKVTGLYLRKATEGTDFVFTSGIIEVDDTFSIMDSENMVLKNLIPGAEYFLAEDTGTALDTAPFIDTFVITDNRSAGSFNITTEVVAKASKIKITMKPSADSGLADFSITRSFDLDPDLGEQRISQSIIWDFTTDEINKLPRSLTFESTYLIKTNLIQFAIELNMVKSEIEETRDEIIEDFKLQDTGDITLEIVKNAGTPSETTENIIVEESTLYLRTNGLTSVLLASGIGGSPIMKLVETIGLKAKENYTSFPTVNSSYRVINTGDLFIPRSSNKYNLVEIKNELTDIYNTLNTILYSEEYTNLGFNRILALLGTEVTSIDAIVDNLNNALIVLQDNYKAASLVFQSTESDLQKAITEAKSVYDVTKSTYDHLVSDIFILTQKRNAVEVKIIEIATQIQNLIDAKASVTTNMLNISSVIDSYNNLIAVNNSKIALYTSNLEQIKTNISTSLSNMITVLGTIKTLITNSINYELSYWNISSTTSAVTFTDKQKVLPRILHKLKNIYTLILEVESGYTLYKASQLVYETALAAYTTDIINGTLTFAEQLLRNDEVNTLKEDYDIKKSNYDYSVNQLVIARDVKDKLLPTFTLVKDACWGELFFNIVPNTDANSTVGDMDLTTFTIKLSKPHTQNLDFEFIYKEDTHGTVRINLAAGSTSASVSMYLESITDTNIDAGLPMWVAYIAGTTTKVDIFNLNKFNQMLMDDAVVLSGGDTTQKDSPTLYTLNKADFVANPSTSSDSALDKKPTQSGSKLKLYTELLGVFNDTQTIIDNLDAYDLNKVDYTTNESLLAQEKNLLVYNTSSLEAVIVQQTLGVDTISSYDVEILYLTSKKTWYKSTTDTIDLVGSDLSYDVCAAKISQLEVTKSTTETTLVSKLALYEAAKTALATATEEALGEFIDGIVETNKLIALKTDLKDKIIVMYDLYNERVSILNNIFANISNLLISGIFSGEWVYAEEFLLNEFEYQDALENLLTEIINDTIKIPLSSIITPNILTYEVGVNGLQYPMDLQPWIFVKTSGKISTRRYPGATYIGTALNQNTIVLNIQHRPTGDISEFLNVYGNENDFNDQMIAKYRSAENAKLIVSITSAINALTTKIDTITNLLSTSPKTITKTINGKTLTITNNLTSSEMLMLDNLIQNLVTSSTNDKAETQTAIYKKEFLLRLIYSKFYGSSLELNDFNAFEYLFNTVPSASSWYNTTGNTVLNSGPDPFNPTETSGKTYIQYIQYLFEAINGSDLNESTLKELFLNKVSLIKDLDILNYILMILPEPTVDYNAKETFLKSNYQLLLQYKLYNSRYILNDDPTTSNDDFENPDLTDEEISTRLASTTSTFATKIATNLANLANTQTTIDNAKTTHENIVKRIARYESYNTFYNSLKLDIKNAINVLNDKLALYTQIKVELAIQLKSVQTTYLSYYNKMNKLPNVMWDIFRITNYQRTKWNYTYMALRILGMQKELNNVVTNNVIQYSPINSEISELTLKKSAAITAGEETAAYAYDVALKAAQQKKINFTNILQGIIDEFNVIQTKYNKATITADVSIDSTVFVEELYMQNPNDYNLSYAFAPYPMYKDSL